ncbi:PstS family phosphate ABC transporter substrate-binding protein [Pontibacter vulgaris]|uniref:PstS family phosphate ABC transporter substrate-binding protein n=1 Tax=Pontibacter vulgaris TaxID=2905679 RepID=UPI001FA72EB6|nr:substrate-binding domain-containing protein [Pontibacter vulgaris]
MAGLKINRLNYLLAASMAWLVMSCNQSGKVDNTPTSGELKIGVDESFEPILESQVNTFEGIYKYASITPSYKAEGAIVKDLLNDSIRIAVLSRELSADEKAVFEKQKKIPRVTKIAVDAIALIVNNNNPDTLLTMEQVKSLFSGKVNNWNKLNSKNPLQNVTIVFDNNSSSTARFVKDSLLNKVPLPANTFAANSNKALIDYVAKNNNAIGVIGVNWISDQDDSTAVGFLKKVKVVGISSDPAPLTTESYYQPYQAYIAQAVYPLRRNLYIINTEGRAGLGTGFVAFVAGDQGQRIILKSGLVPATMPVRIVGLR